MEPGLPISPGTIPICQRDGDRTRAQRASIQEFESPTQATLAGGAAHRVDKPAAAFSGADNSLIYLSDRSGYWNLYDESGLALYPVDADCGGARLGLWSIELCHRRRWSDRRCNLAQCEGQLVVLGSGSVRDRASTHQLSSLAMTESRKLVALGGSAKDPLGVIEIDLKDNSTTTLHASKYHRSGLYLNTSTHELSLQRMVLMPTPLLPSKNNDFQGAPGERPPLIVQSHGGPTTKLLTTGL